MQPNVALLVCLFAIFALGFLLFSLQNWRKEATAILPKILPQPSAEGLKVRCLNKGQHLNDWDYFFDKVLHVSKIYKDVNVENYKAQDSERWTNLKEIFRKYFAEFLKKPFVQEKQTIRIIEIGAWKGLSARTMGTVCKSFKRNCTILSIDTWLGAWIGYTNPGHVIHRQLTENRGQPGIFKTFLRNIKVTGLEKSVFPLRLPSTDAAKVLQCFQMRADLIYVDGDHEYVGVKADLDAFFPLLKSEGLLFGDDIGRPSVRKAVEELLEKEGIQKENNRLQSNTWLAWKP